MTNGNSEALSRVDIVDYDPRWSALFAQELIRITSRSTIDFVRFEHIGSTAVWGQRSKPIIDMMASVEDLAEANSIERQLDLIGYSLILTGMSERLLFRRKTDTIIQAYQLHVVAQHSWERRKERLMRDYLRGHPEAVRRYGDLKEELAREHREDSLAYTRAKTAFIQELIDQACDERGLARFDIWAN